jgi:hypothetical protein
LFTFKTGKQERKNLNDQGLKSFYFDAHSSKAIGNTSISAFLDELSERCGFENPGDVRPTFYECHRLGITHMAANGVTASESMGVTRHKSMDVHTVYAEANHATREQRIRAQFATGQLMTFLIIPYCTTPCLLPPPAA